MLQQRQLLFFWCDCKSKEDECGVCFSRGYRSVQLVGGRSSSRSGPGLLGWGSAWKPPVYLWPAAQLSGFSSLL